VRFSNKNSFSSFQNALIFSLWLKILRGNMLIVLISGLSTILQQHVFFEVFADLFLNLIFFQKSSDERHVKVTNIFKAEPPLGIFSAGTFII